MFVMCKRELVSASRTERVATFYGKQHERDCRLSTINIPLSVRLAKGTPGKIKYCLVVNRCDVEFSSNNCIFSNM